MRKHAKDNRPSPKPVIKAELAEGKKTTRIIFIAIFLALGITLIAFSAAKLLGRESGFTEIEADKSPFSSFFVMNYDIGASGATASAEYRRVKEVYTAALDKYCKLFSSDTAYEGTNNLFYLNSHPGERVTLAPELYAALSRLERVGAGRHYLGTVLEMYDVTFSCSEDGYAALSDPMKNDALGAVAREACAFANDRLAVSLEFFEDSSVTLHIGEGYRAFAEANALTRFIDLGIFENAFVVDAIADTLESEGLCFGSVSSYDGYARNLDTREDAKYSFSYYAKSGDKVYPVCDVAYEGAIATCTLKSYPTGALDGFDFYLYSDGVSVHRILDKSTAAPVAAVPELLLASKSEDTVSLALRAYSALGGHELRPDSLEGVFAAWLDGYTVKSQKLDSVTLTAPYADDKISFVIE